MCVFAKVLPWCSRLAICLWTRSCRRICSLAVRSHDDIACGCIIKRSKLPLLQILQRCYMPGLARMLTALWRC